MRGTAYIALVLRQEVRKRGGEWRGCQVIHQELRQRHGREAITAQTIWNACHQRAAPAFRTIDQIHALIGLDLTRVFTSETASEYVARALEKDD